MEEIHNIEALKIFLQLSNKDCHKFLKKSNIETLLQIWSQMIPSLSTSKRNCWVFAWSIFKTLDLYPTEIENEKLVKIILKGIIEISAKERQVSGSSKIQLTELVKIMADKSKQFVKFVRQAFKKMEFNSLNKMLNFFGKVENKEILSDLMERIKDEFSKLSNHKRPWNPVIFTLFSKTEGMNIFASLIREAIRQSIESVKNIVEILYELNQTQMENGLALENVFDLNFSDAFARDESLTVALFQMATKILANNNAVVCKSKAESFISFVNQKMNRCQSQNLIVMYCRMTAQLCFNFDPKIKNETLAQFIDSLGALKSTIEINNIGNLLSQNKSLSKAEVIQYLVDRKKQAEQPAAMFMISKLVDQRRNYQEFLNEFHEKNAKQKITFSNYKNYLFSLVGKIDQAEFDGSPVFDFLQHVVNRESYFIKSSFFEGLSKVEIEAILVILISVSNEAIKKVQFSEGEKHTYGLFLINALNYFFKTWHSFSGRFERKSLKFIIKSLLIYLFSDNRPRLENEKFGQILRYLLVDSKFVPKNRVITSKIICLVSIEGLISKSQFALIIKSEFFKNEIKEVFPDALYRILSKDGLFAETQFQFSFNLFVNLLYFYPSLFKQMMFFFSKKNLRYLLSMSKMAHAIESIKPFNISFFFEREEFQILGIKEKLVTVPKGKGKQIVDDLFDDVRFLSEVHIVDVDIGQNEDEKFDELKLENNKAVVLKTCGRLLARLNSAFLTFFKYYSTSFTAAHLEIIQKHLHLFKENLKTVEYFPDILKGLYGCLLQHSSRNTSTEFSQLLEYNFGILRKNDSPQFVRNLEYFIRTSNFSKLNVTKEIFEILFETMDFVFENKIDTEYKRKLFYFIYKKLGAYQDYINPFLEFICKHFNELHFDEAFESFRSILIKLLSTDSNIVNKTLNEVLNYEDFVVSYLLKTLIEVSRKEDVSTQRITVLQLLKILILTESEDDKTAALAKELISTNQLYKFGPPMFDSLEFTTIIREFPTDLHQIIAKILAGIFISIDQEQQCLFLKIFIDQTKDLVLNSKYENEEKLREDEQKYQLFPMTLFHLVEFLTKDFIFSIFEYIFERHFNEMILLGLAILNQSPDICLQIVKICEAKLFCGSNLISPTIFIGETVLINHQTKQMPPQLNQKLQDLMKVSSVEYQSRLSKHLRRIVCLIENPGKLIDVTLAGIQKLKDKNEIQSKCLYCAGILKGLRVKHLINMKVFDQLNEIITSSKKKDFKDIEIGKRFFCVYMISSLWHAFGKVLEPFLEKIFLVLTSLMGDAEEAIRNHSDQIMKKIMQEISEYGVKFIIPVLIKGSNDKNWRTKLNSIHSLGFVAHFRTKQLSTCLPLIVPQLTSMINDTNIDIKEAAVSSLSLIVSTIKNPEIIDNRDVLIKSLSDPFHFNNRSLDLLLQTRFQHYIDGPALSLIMPIIIYGLKFSNNNASKINSAKVVANISSLINNDNDILSNIDSLIDALMVSLKDVDTDVRAYTSKAFKSLAVKFPSLSKMMLNILKSILETESFSPAGAAQGFSEVLSTLEEREFEPIMENSLSLTCDSRDYIRESFLSVFVYLPIVMEDRFEKYVFGVINGIVESISHLKEGIRNLAIKSIKTLIRRFLKKNIEVLINPFNEGAFSDNSTKQNSSLILLGDILDILSEEFRDKETLYESYPKLISIFYIMKNDLCGEVRITATNIFKTFVDNPQRCLKIIIHSLIDTFIELFVREKEHYDQISNNGLKEFSYKYGDLFLTKVLAYVTYKKNQADLKTKRGICLFVNHFVRFFNGNQLSSDKKLLFYELLYSLYNEDDECVWRVATQGLRILSEISKDPKILDEVLKNYYPEFENYDSTHEKFEKMVCLLCEFLKSRKQSIILSVVGILVQDSIKDWSLEVFMRNTKLLGSLLYNSEELKSGVQYLLKDLETQETLIFTLSELCSNIENSAITLLINDFQILLAAAIRENQFKRITNLITVIRLYFEKVPIETLIAGQSLTILSLELIAYQGPSADEIYTQLGKLLSVI